MWCRGFRFPCAPNLGPTHRWFRNLRWVPSALGVELALYTIYQAFFVQQITHWPATKDEVHKTLGSTVSHKIVGHLSSQAKWNLLTCVQSSRKSWWSPRSSRSWRSWKCKYASFVLTHKRQMFLPTQDLHEAVDIGLLLFLQGVDVLHRFLPEIGVCYLNHNRIAVIEEKGKGMLQTVNIRRRLFLSRYCILISPTLQLTRSACARSRIR